MNKKIMTMFNNLHTCKGVNEAVSMFVPSRVDGHIVDNAFLYSNQPKAQKSRPTAKVVFDYPTATVLVYTNARVLDFIDTETHPFDKPIDYSLPNIKTLSEQSELLNKASELYPIVRTVAYKETLGTEDMHAIKEYQRILEKAVPNDLMPFYRALSPEYFEWVESII